MAGQSFRRHPGQFDRYPYHPNGYGPERVDQMLLRWIAWLGDMMDYDGLRLDAGKHVPWEFFGTRGCGFLHEAQFHYNLRRGYTDPDGSEADQLFQNHLAEGQTVVGDAVMIIHNPDYTAYEIFVGVNGVTNADHNFTHHEINFGKSVPNFKRYPEARGRGPVRGLSQADVIPLRRMPKAH